MLASGLDETWLASRFAKKEDYYQQLNLVFKFLGLRNTLLKTVINDATFSYNVLGEAGACIVWSCCVEMKINVFISPKRNCFRKTCVLVIWITGHSAVHSRWISRAAWWKIDIVSQRYYGRTLMLSSRLKAFKWNSSVLYRSDQNRWSKMTLFGIQPTVKQTEPILLM